MRQVRRETKKTTDTGDNRDTEDNTDTRDKRETGDKMTHDTTETPTPET